MSCRVAGGGAVSAGGCVVFSFGLGRHFVLRPGPACDPACPGTWCQVVVLAYLAGSLSKLAAQCVEQK